MPNAEQTPQASDLRNKDPILHFTGVCGHCLYRTFIEFILIVIFFAVMSERRALYQAMQVAPVEHLSTWRELVITHSLCSTIFAHALFGVSLLGMVPHFMVTALIDATLIGFGILTAEQPDMSMMFDFQDPRPDIMLMWGSLLPLPYLLVTGSTIGGLFGCLLQLLGEGLEEMRSKGTSSQQGREDSPGLLVVRAPAIDQKPGAAIEYVIKDE
ncbi:hypothetical protein CB0940_06673 [Cercospora beticola]|uniref:Uncharacterized protein n=1 Tax=Cercospora beticola TaxID=122368 RepID=A0A2G5HZN1_CERBT|nr:hypothetical protein CB0940_06673 [Cercospora beticola]PIA97713.1 hypothetical protein CB0940_06673 [Cercospora beticola]WPA99339.1 hypothetical protein RHO25_003956 [Cercospora beticola]CAK1360666.1 unnamed protein product [Cercospora beticola]